MTKRKLNFRGDVSKFELAECYFRGGYELGYERALADIQTALSPVQAHVQDLTEWAGGDPTIEREPPALALLPRIAEKCRLTS